MSFTHGQSPLRSLLLLVCVLSAGCVAPIKSLYPPSPGEPTRTVWVVNHGGLHTGLAVERPDIPEKVWPANMDYPAARYLEVGWGDDDGYRKDLTPWIVAKALFRSTRTVLLYDGFTNSLVENFDDPKYQVIEIKLSQRGFARLCEHIEKTHALDESGQPIRFGNDWYKGRGTYCFLHTCNTWTAKSLRAAGCPITPAYCITPRPLLYQARKFGRAVSR